MYQYTSCINKSEKKNDIRRLSTWPLFNCHSYSSKHLTNQAGANFDPKMAEEHFVKLLGSKGVQIPNKVNHKMYKTEDESYDNLFGRIPRYFDARKKWRHCSTIGTVRDQGNCGSCWVKYQLICMCQNLTIHFKLFILLGIGNELCFRRSFVCSYKRRFQSIVIRRRNHFLLSYMWFRMSRWLSDKSLGTF